MSKKIRKVFIAIPSQFDAVKVNTMLCIMDALVDGLIEGIALEIHSYAGITPISSARNFALAQFLASDCDDLVFIDDDLAWERGALIRLIKHPVDFVCGAYPYRVDPENYPIRWCETPNITADEYTGLVEIQGAGFGFAKISRNCVEKMVAAYPHQKYPEKGAPNGEAWLLFQLDVVENGIVFSEDMIFGKRWRAIGGKVWLDPEIWFMHIGNKGFTGRLGDFLRRKIMAEEAAKVAPKSLSVVASAA